MTKTVYSYHPATGQFIGPVLLNDSDKSPMEEGVYLIPGDMTEIAPPATQGAQRAIWTGGEWVVVDELVSDVPIESVPLTPAQIEYQHRLEAKAARAAAVEAITVTTAAGNTFDGDETAQTRMARAVLVLSTGAALSVPWVLADNTVIQADAAELTEALALAGAEQARLWVL